MKEDLGGWVEFARTGRKQSRSRERGEPKQSVKVKCAYERGNKLCMKRGKER